MISRLANGRDERVFVISSTEKVVEEIENNDQWDDWPRENDEQM